MTAEPVLGASVRELIAIGASIGGNCLPCLRYHFAEAIKAGCSVKDIEEAIELSKMVKERPMKDIYRLADDLLQRERETKSLRTSKEEDADANL
jgi:AhpD family alkylhydroperoxidase